MSATGLSIPEITEEYGIASAMLRYANSGFYVGPLAERSKNPGAILGDGWQHKTSTDKDQIVAWATDAPCHGVFLHAGRSGALFFDVDHPENVPEILANAIWERDADGTILRAKVPFQRTRPEDPWRGHYLFAMPPGRLIGNGLGGLKTDQGWGEVRGYNGIIVASPTVHELDEGCYEWVVPGPLPMLPSDIAALLPDAGTIEDAATDDAVKAFMADHREASRAALMKVAVQQFIDKVDAGQSRHESMVSVACMAMREAAMGFYPARTVANDLFTEFHRVLSGTPRRWPKHEFKSIIAYAVGQALGVDAEQRREEALERLRQRDEARKEAAPAPMGQTEIPPDPVKYFLDKTIGMDAELLARDVVLLGPIGVSPDGMTWKYDHGVWIPDKYVIRDRTVHLLGSRYRCSHTNTIDDVVCSRAPEVHGDPVEGFWNCENGMVNWRTGEVVEHSPDFYSTVQFPFVWDPDATCPQFDAFLEEVLSPDYVKLCWQMLAYALYSGNPLQTAFMMFGGGSNGKSVVIKVLMKMLGDRSFSALTLTTLNKNRFATINLFGKIANIMGDIDATFQEDTAMFRALTGADPISAERKFGDMMHFRCWAVPIFSANKIPGVADPGHHYFRRWQVIHFQKTFDGKDVIPDIEERFYPEVPGIAAKCMPILRDLLASKMFYTDGDVQVGKKEFEKAVDQVRQWADECTIPAEGHAENRTELYKSYSAWASANGFGRMKSTEFFNRLDSAGYKAGKSAGMRVHRGLRLMELRLMGLTPEHELRDSWE